MRFQKGQRIEVEGRKGWVIDHSADKPHLVVVRFDDGGIHKVGMHRVRVLSSELI